MKAATPRRIGFLSLQNERRNNTNSKWHSAHLKQVFKASFCLYMDGGGPTVHGWSLVGCKSWMWIAIREKRLPDCNPARIANFVASELPESEEQ